MGQGMPVSPLPQSGRRVGFDARLSQLQWSGLRHRFLGGATGILDADEGSALGASVGRASIVMEPRWQAISARHFVPGRNGFREPESRGPRSVASPRTWLKADVEAVGRCPGSAPKPATWLHRQPLECRALHPCSNQSQPLPICWAGSKSIFRGLGLAPAIRLAQFVVSTVARPGVSE
jgi:hypothetical protein